jgi:hypothetical protein
MLQVVRPNPCVYDHIVWLQKEATYIPCRWPTELDGTDPMTTHTFGGSLTIHGFYCITTASLPTPHLWNCTDASSIKWQTNPRNPPVRGITVPPLLEIPCTRRLDTTTSSARMVVKIVTTSNAKHGHSLKSDRDITHFVPNRGRVPIPCLAFPSTKKAAERCCENGFESDTTLLQHPTCQQPSFIGMERTIQMCVLDIVARLDLAVMFI